MKPLQGLLEGGGRLHSQEDQGQPEPSDAATNPPPSLPPSMTKAISLLPYLPNRKCYTIWGRRVFASTSTRLHAMSVMKV